MSNQIPPRVSTRDSLTTAELRKTLLRNGFYPTPNVGKACYLERWPKVEITPELIDRWSRRNARFPDTGLRIQDGLAAIDLDIDDEPGLYAVAEAIEAEFPQLRAGALVRYGKGVKEAWFCRTAEPFSRLHTHRFWAPGRNNPDKDTAHCAEIFGGASARQFGAFGAHTRDDRGDVVVAYEWAEGRSPLTVPLAELPELTKEDFVRISELVGLTLRGLGFEQVMLSIAGENRPHRVYDLTDDMLFECNDGVTRTLEELEFLAGYPGLRCSASWLEPGRGHSLTRCLVGRSHRLDLTLWDSAHEVTHMAAHAAPQAIAQRVADRTAAAGTKLQKMRETCHD